MIQWLLKTALTLANWRGYACVIVLADFGAPDPDGVIGLMTSGWPWEKDLVKQKKLIGHMLEGALQAHRGELQPFVPPKK